jgi:hypothetical protein
MAIFFDLRKHGEDTVEISLSGLDLTALGSLLHCQQPVVIYLRAKNENYESWQSWLAILLAERFLVTCDPHMSTH